MLILLGIYNDIFLMFAESSQIILMWLGFYMDTVDLRISVGMKSIWRGLYQRINHVDLHVCVGMKRLGHLSAYAKQV